MDNKELIDGTVVTGISNDIIKINGDLQNEFNAYDCTSGIIAFSDGTLLRVFYDLIGRWKFKTLYNGTLLKDTVNGSVDEHDKVYFNKGLKWCIFSENMQTEFK